MEKFDLKIKKNKNGDNVAGVVVTSIAGLLPVLNVNELITASNVPLFDTSTVYLTLSPGDINAA